MAAPIAAVVLASPSRKSVRLHTYVSTEKEGQKKGDRFVAQSGLNGCIPEFAERQFRDNRKRWGKNAERTVERGGRKFREGQYVQAYHLIQSFARDGVGALDPKSSDDWEKAHELGMLLAKRVAGDGRMATVTTQIDGKTGCLHNHIVIDSVDKITGRSFNSAGVKHKLLAAAHDEVLKDAGYEQVNTLTSGAVKVEKSELRAAAKHAEWQVDPSSGSEPFSVAVMKQRIREAMDSPRSFDFGMFARECRRLGVEVQRSTARNGQGLSYRMLRLEDAEQGTYLPPARGDVRRAAKLGTEFTMDAVQAAIVRNLNTPRQHQATLLQPTIAPTTSVPDRSKKRTSYAAATDMPAPKSAPLPRDAKKPDPFADLYAEWDADKEREIAALKAKLSIGKTLAQIDAEKAVEAATAAPEPAKVVEAPVRAPEPVKSREATSFATAADMAAPADAPLSQDAIPEPKVREEQVPSAVALGTTVPAYAAAPAVTANKFRSLLRDVRVRDHKRQELIDAMAAFDERSVELLERSEMFAEADVPLGVGRKFLDFYSDKIDPEVLYILDLRQQKKELAEKLWDRSVKMPEPIRDELRQKARRLRDEIAAGDYDQDDEKAPQKDDEKGPQKRVLGSGYAEPQLDDDEWSLG